MSEPFLTAAAVGDLLVGAADGTWVAMPAGSPGQVLTVDPASPIGLSWSTASASAVDPFPASYAPVF